MLAKRKFSEACERNKQYIFDVLEKEFPSKATILEIASGTGQHADFFTKQMPTWTWQCTDVDHDSLRSIFYYKNTSGQSNFLTPLHLSTLDTEWPIGQFDAAFCANMLHIAPIAATVGLFKNLSTHLKKDAPLALYGPFLQDGIKTAQSNIIFDTYLKTLDPNFGLRNLTSVSKVAAQFGFMRHNAFDMPAHNLLVLFKKLS